MKQRLGLAQAIMENPDILILDEPMKPCERKVWQGLCLSYGIYLPDTFEGKGICFLL